MSLVALAAIIVLIVMVLGVGTTAILIMLDMNGAPSGRSQVIMLSGSIGIAASIAFLLSMRARRRQWLIRIDDQFVVITSGRFIRVLPLSELRLIQLRRHTDYARIIFVAGTGRVSLLAGLGLAPDPRDTEAAYLPEFSTELQARLRSAGYAEHRSPKSPDLSKWTQTEKASET